MKVSKEEIENFVILHANNVFQRYYWHCPVCLKPSNTILSICRIQKSFQNHRRKSHPRMKVIPNIVQHNYPDIKYLNSKELHILWLSLLEGKKNYPDDIELYSKCMKYVKDVMNMIEGNERSRNT